MWGKNKKIGHPDKIKQLCKIYGFDDNISKIIALDGEMLDKELENRFKEHKNQKAKL